MYPWDPFEFSLKGVKPEYDVSDMQQNTLRYHYIIRPSFLHIVLFTTGFLEANMQNWKFIGCLCLLWDYFLKIEVMFPQILFLLKKKCSSYNNVIHSWPKIQKTKSLKLGIGNVFTKLKLSW